MASSVISKRPIVAVDLFCGAGGLTRGLLNAGISVVLGIDCNADYRTTYETNNAPAKFLCSDISDISAADIVSYLPPAGKYDLALVGCAPCQPFSSHRRFRQSCGDSHLLREFGRLVGELSPDWLFMENVPGIANVRGYSTFLRFKKTLTKLKFNFDYDTVDAKRFGVPQTRRRFLLIASRTSSVQLPAPSHGPGLLPYRTVRDAIRHYPPLQAGHRSKKFVNHQAANLSQVNLRRLKRTPSNGGGRTDWPKSLELECHKDTRGHEDVYGRMQWNSPAPTLTCRCYSISNGRYGHPTQHRAISFREAASLQTFPNAYSFTGKSQRSLGEQIGNAVPVALAQAIGNQLIVLSGLSKGQQARKKGRKRRRKNSDG